MAEERAVKGVEPVTRLRKWPPETWPPPEPMPNAQDLHHPFDWMTFSHHDLHLMATTLLHLENAQQVADQWVKLATSLETIGDELAKLTKLTRGGWEGEAAELARATGAELSQWADRASKQAKVVANCLDRHIDNAEWASRAMPEPPRHSDMVPDSLPNWRLDDPFHPSPPSNPPAPEPAGFSHGGFAMAGHLVADDGPEREHRAQLHQRAAEVMHRLQMTSAEVYDDVPRFDADHRNKPVHHGGHGHGSHDPREHDGHRHSETHDAGEPDHADASHGHAVAHAVDVPPAVASDGAGDEVPGSTSAAGASVPGGDAGGFGPGALGGGLGAGSGSGSGSGGGSGMGAGPRSGVGPFGAPFGGGAVAAGGASGVRGGGMPMTPMGGGRGAGEQSKDKNAAEYLLGDRSVFLPDGTYTPEVIGALPGEMDEDQGDR